VLEWIGWGSYAQSGRYSFDFIKGSYLLNDELYLRYAKINMGPQLGNNPQGLSYITGIGSRYPMAPLQHPSDHDASVEPVPGIPVFGPMAHIPMSNDYYYQAQCTDNLYPAGEQVGDPYPLLRRYYDIFELVHMSEFTITDMAMATAVLGFLSDTDDCSGVAFCDANVNSTGGSAVISSNGQCAVAQNQFALTAQPVPAGPGLFFFSAGQLESAVPLFNGVRCIGPSVIRLPVVLSSLGVATHQLDFTSGTAANIQAGQTWHFQYWFRDVPGGGLEANLSDGLSVAFQ